MYGTSHSLLFLRRRVHLSVPPSWFFSSLSHSKHVWSPLGPVSNGNQKPLFRGWNVNLVTDLILLWIRSIGVSVSVLSACVFPATGHFFVLLIACDCCENAFYAAVDWLIFPNLSHKVFIHVVRKYGTESAVLKVEAPRAWFCFLPKLSKIRIEVCLWLTQWTYIMLFLYYYY